MKLPPPPSPTPADPPAAAPGSGRAVRGRYLSRHHARVIEQDDNVVVVEFVERPWYTAAARADSRRRRARRALSATSTVVLPVWQVALLWGLPMSALTIGLLRLM